MKKKTALGPIITVILLAVLAVSLAAACSHPAAKTTTPALTTAARDTAPTVNSVSPADLATGIPIDTVIAAVFSKEMDPATINTATFNLQQATKIVSGTVTYSGAKAIFKPSSSLSYSDTYAAFITSGVKDLAGNALEKVFVWSFSTVAAPNTTMPEVSPAAPNTSVAGNTDSMPYTPTPTASPVVADNTLPAVSSVSPSNLASGIPLDTVIAATFSEAMDPSSINTTTFTLLQTTKTINGAVTCSGKTAAFTPSAALSYSSTYKATITTAAKDLAGNTLEKDFVWSL
jgi:hypothetical protein